MDRSRHRTRIVLVIGSDAVERERVAASLRGVADQVRQCATLSDVDASAVSESAAVIVLAPDAASTALLETALRPLRVGDSATAMVLCFRSANCTEHQLATLARAGLDEVVVMDLPGAMERLRREVTHRLEHALPIELVRRVDPQVEWQAHRYCTWCFRNAFRPLEVHSIADWFREDPTTVNRHLHLAGLRELSKMISSARLLHIANRLDSTSATIATISRILHFRDPSALSKFVRHASGYSPSHLRALGAIARTTNIIERAIRAP